MRTALATLLAVLTLAGCGASTTTAGTTAGHSAGATAPSCHAQYEGWKHGPAKALAAKLKTALNGVQAQAGAEDLPRMTAALRHSGALARKLAVMAPPRCADPAGDYGKMLALIGSAGDNARSAGGLGGIALALAPLKSFAGAERRLNAELDRTVGKTR